jgi:serine/threonine-protein kinase HipA
MSKVNESRLAVYLSEHPVGELRVREDTARFVFLQSYLEDPNRAVLGLRFEDNLIAECKAHMRLPPWFANLLPEGALRARIAEAACVPDSREWALLAHVGHDLPGAVRVVPGNSDASPSPKAQANPSREEEDLAKPRLKFSLAGVNLKLSMLARGDRFTAPANDAEGGDWIIKLPDPKHPHVPRNEFAMMTLARASGIQVPDLRLPDRESLDAIPDGFWPSTERLAFAIRRFDRAPDRSRIHIEDLAQVRGFYGDDKYEGTFETIASLIYRKHDVASLQEFARRMAFNILIGNGDAHLKNWSLIYHDPRRPILAPAYDLVSTFAYIPDEDLGLKFGRSRSFEDVTLDTFQALEKKLDAKADLRDVVASFTRNVGRSWEVAANALSACPVLRDRIKARLDFFSPRFS